MFVSALRENVVGIYALGIIHRQVIFLTDGQVNILIFEIFALPLLTLKDL